MNRLTHKPAIPRSWEWYELEETNEKLWTMEDHLDAANKRINVLDNRLDNAWRWFRRSLVLNLILAATVAWMLWR